MRARFFHLGVPRFFWKEKRPHFTRLAPRNTLFQSSAGLLSQSRLSDTRKKDSGKKERDRMGEVFPETKSNLIELKNSRKINTSESDFFKKVRAWGWRRETSQAGPPKCQDLIGQRDGSEASKRNTDHLALLWWQQEEDGVSILSCRRGNRAEASLSLEVEEKFPVIWCQWLEGWRRKCKGGFPGGPVVENHLPMQGTQVGSLVQEDPTCRWTTQPVHHKKEPES